MSDPEHEHDNDQEDVLSTLIIKVPFLLLGIALGMLTVYVGMQWIPSTVAVAKTALAP